MCAEGALERVRRTHRSAQRDGCVTPRTGECPGRQNGRARGSDLALAGQGAAVRAEGFSAVETATDHPSTVAPRPSRPYRPGPSRSATSAPSRSDAAYTSRPRTATWWTAPRPGAGV